MTKNKETKPRLVVILGPTASGKTSLGIRLAKEFRGEIISADSRQIYKEMNVGTAKPLKNEGIPHHMIDLVYPDEEFSAADFKKEALRVIQEIIGRERLPLLVGGTGLYIQAVVDNLLFPRVSPKNELRKRLEEKGIQELFSIYKKIDPRGAEFIERKNKRRLIRAIEVCKVKQASFWKQRKKGKPLFQILQIGTKISKKELRKRISQRTEKMFQVGLEKEVRRLFKKYGSSPLLETIGYQEWIPFLDEEIALRDKIKIKAKIKLHTFQFAKRQMKWFKRDYRIHWIKTYRQAKKLVAGFL